LAGDPGDELRAGHTIANTGAYSSSGEDDCPGQKGIAHEFVSGHQTPPWLRG
jgi:hypothetical protein